PEARLAPSFRGDCPRISVGCALAIGVGMAGARGCWLRHVTAELELDAIAPHAGSEQIGHWPTRLASSRWDSGTPGVRRPSGVDATAARSRSPVPTLRHDQERRFADGAGLRVVQEFVRPARRLERLTAAHRGTGRCDTWLSESQATMGPESGAESRARVAA